MELLIDNETLDKRIKELRKSKAKEDRKLLKKPKKKRRKKLRKPLKYKKYIKSALWRKIRKSYFSRVNNECVVCGSKRTVSLHHLSYANLGKEKDSDLVALCWGHHEEYHQRHGLNNLRKNSYLFIQEKQEELEAKELFKNL